MRTALLLLTVVAAGCAAEKDVMGAKRPQVLRDVEGYAVASCLVNQREPYLKDQGDAWAAVVVQRMKGDLDVLAAVADQVKLEATKGEMAVARNESASGGDKALPVLYCSEIIDKPAVREAIQRAARELAPSYRP